MNVPLSRLELLNAIRAEKNSRKTQEDLVEERKELLSSHLAFTRRFFVEKEGQPFSVAAFHEVMCWVLDRVYAGEIKRLIINIPPGFGKAIDCDTPMLTPSGWVRAGDIRNGDMLLGSAGQWTEVTGVFPQGVIPAFTVTFSDRSSIVACSEHRWAARLRDGSNNWHAPWQVKTTDELARDLREADGRKKWRIPVLSDTRSEDIDLPIDPYLFGCWLGDGHSYQAAITTMDADIITAFSEFSPVAQKHQNAGRATTYSLRNRFVTRLRALGVLGNKHIPNVYMLASHRQRVALLQGICDTDGTVNRKSGGQSVTLSCKALSDDVRSLINSIGGVWRGYERKAGKKIAYTTMLSLPDGVSAFRLPRKSMRVNPRKACNMPRRFVDTVAKTSDREMVCFTVDADDHLFCAGRDLVVTHNTELAVINFIAHGFAINPRARFIHASYAEPLALDNSTKVKDIITLPGYQALWPVTMRSDTNAKGLWRTTAGGHLRASAAGMPITGFRAGILEESGFTGALVIDDPLKPDDASSEKLRKFINARWENTFRSRLAHEDVPVIVIMQRLHVDDFAAHLMQNSGEQWHLLSLPVLIQGEVEAPGGNVTVIPHGLPDGPLWEAKHNEEQIKVLQLSPTVYAGQYAQNPIVAGGNLFKTDWLVDYDDLPPLKWRAVYADTAQKTKERNDYTVFEHWGAGHDGRAYLIDLVRGRFEAPELESTALALWAKAKLMDPQRYGMLRKMSIEDKVSGTGLIQSLRRKAIPVVAVQRDKDKYTRALDVVPLVASGLVCVPKIAPWRQAFSSEYAAFPDGSFDDQMDPFMDAVTEMCGGKFSLSISREALKKA